MLLSIGLPIEQIECPYEWEDSWNISIVGEKPKLYLNYIKEREEQEYIAKTEEQDCTVNDERKLFFQKKHYEVSIRIEKNQYMWCYG